jgi:hypothetical protein
VAINPPFWTGRRRVRIRRLSGRPKLRGLDPWQKNAFLQERTRRLCELTRADERDPWPQNRGEILVSDSWEHCRPWSFLLTSCNCLAHYQYFICFVKILGAVHRRDIAYHTRDATLTFRQPYTRGSICRSALKSTKDLMNTSSVRWTVSSADCRLNCWGGALPKIESGIRTRTTSSSLETALTAG